MKLDTWADFQFVLVSPSGVGCALASWHMPPNFNGTGDQTPRFGGPYGIEGPMKAGTEREFLGGNGHRCRRSGSGSGPHGVVTLQEEAAEEGERRECEMQQRPRGDSHGHQAAAASRRFRKRAVAGGGAGSGRDTARISPWLSEPRCHRRAPSQGFAAASRVGTVASRISRAP